MSHRRDCPSPWDAERQAQDDYRWHGPNTWTPYSSDCDEAARAYDAEIERLEDERRAEHRLEERRREEAELERQMYEEAERRAEEEAYWREMEAEHYRQAEAQYYAWAEEDYRLEIVEMGRWADDGGSIIEPPEALS